MQTADIPTPELGPSDPVELAAAPSATEIERSRLTTVLPALSVLGMVGFAVFVANPVLIALSGGLAVLSIGGALLAVRLQRRRADRSWAARCMRYRAHLTACARQLDEAARRQAAYDAHQHRGATRPSEPDFLRVRLGLGRTPARRQPRMTPAGAEPTGDDALTAAAAEVLGRHGAVDALTVRLDLRPGTRTVLRGPLTDVLRALVCELAATHRVGELGLHVLAPAAELTWLTELPHCRSSGVHDADALLQAVRADRSGAAQLVVLAGPTGATAARVWGALPAATDPAAPGVIALLATEWQVPPDATAVIRPAPEGVPGVLVELAGPEPRMRLVPRVDRLSFPAALERALAEASRAAPRARTATGPATLAALLASTSGDRELRLPLGLGDGGPLVLDLTEAAEGGDGPHGLVIGSTGSGKSELLRTLVVAAATRSGPEQLSILLIDYKGGAAFGDLTDLPHLAGLATNLSDDPLAADRLATALRAESRRRQQLLRAARAPDLAAYRRVRATRPELPALPRLLVVIDEYAELVEQSPEALDALTSLGRVGRSLGVHLLLSSQRLDDGKLRGLDAHLRYRVCLRTLDAGDSQSMLGSRAALELPAEPGWAWLNRDGALTRWRVLRADAGDLLAARSWPPATSAVHQVLSPGLAERLCLDAVGPTSPTGLHTVPVGVVDRPEYGRSEVLLADLRRPLAVVGAPGSGRSTTLTTLVAALAESSDPGAVAVHVIAAAGPLASVGGVPHVGTVATEPSLAGVVVGAIADLTRSRRAGASAEQAVLLVVDDAGRLLRERDDLLPDLLTIATAGPAHGVHLALSAGRWSELRGGLREACATRWELPSADVADSEHPQLVRRAGPRPPGRLLTPAGHWAQIALPHRCGCSAEPCPADGSGDDLLTALARRGGPPTPPMRSLPRMVAPALLPPSRTGGVWTGVAGPYLAPLAVPLAGGDHLIVLGNSGSGRTGLLRALAGQLGHRPVWVLDPRRSLGPQHAAAASSPAEINAALTALVGAISADRHSRRPVTDGPVLLIDDLDLACTRETSVAFTALADQLAHAKDDGLSVIAARRASGSVRAGFEPFYGRLLEVCESALILSGDPSEGPVIGGMRPEPRPPGRGRLVRRGEPADLLQAVWTGWAHADEHPGVTTRSTNPDK